MWDALKLNQLLDLFWGLHLLDFTSIQPVSLSMFKCMSRSPQFLPSVGSSLLLPNSEVFDPLQLEMKCTFSYEIALPLCLFEYFSGFHYSFFCIFPFSHFMRYLDFKCDTFCRNHQRAQIGQEKPGVCPMKLPKVYTKRIRNIIQSIVLSAGRCYSMSFVLRL